MSKHPAADGHGLAKTDLRLEMMSNALVSGLNTTCSPRDEFLRLFGG